MKSKPHKELAMYDEINRKTKKAEKDGNIDEEMSLILIKMEMAAKAIKHKGLRDYLLKDVTKLKNEDLLTQTKSINTKRSKRPN
jgi:hypothetical protein